MILVIGGWFSLAWAMLLFLLASPANAQIPPCGQVVDSYKGIAARSNGGAGLQSCSGRHADPVDGVIYGLQYQCVEYVRRFYHAPDKTDPSYDSAPRKWPGKNAIDFYYDNAELGLTRSTNRRSTTPPAVDDIVVFDSVDGNPDGHVAIVREVTATTVRIIEQNFAAGDGETLPLIRDPVSGAYTVGDHLSIHNIRYPVLGWLRTSGGGTFAKLYSPTGQFGTGSGGRVTPDGGFALTGFNFDGTRLNVMAVRLSQQGDLIWQRVFQDIGGSSGADVDTTSDGGFVIVGNRVTSPRSGLVSKLDGNGMPVWHKVFFGTASVGLTSIQQSPDGGYIVGGQLCGLSTCNSGLILKLSANGAIDWQREVVGVSSLTVRRRPDGGYVASGSTGGQAAVVLRLNASGVLESSKSFISSPGFGSVTGVEATRDNGVVFGSGQSVIKLDSAGTVQWAHAYRDFVLDNSFAAQPVRQTSDGGYLLGIAPLGVNLNAGGIAKLDAAGNVVWARYFVRAQTSAHSVAETLDGSYVTFGNADTNNFALVVKVDGGGRIPGCSLLGDLSGVLVTQSLGEVGAGSTIQAGSVVSQDLNLSVTGPVFSEGILCSSGG